METTPHTTRQAATLGIDLNSKLDDLNKTIALGLATARMIEAAKYAWPLVGDVVIWPNGETRRVSHDWDDSFQTCREGSGSFYVHPTGRGSFSGAHMDAQLREFFVLTNEVVPGQFWFFSHNVRGAGRGVQCTLPCRVFQLTPFERTLEQATAHSFANRSAEVWGTGHTEHQRRIESIMKPAVMTDPNNN